MLMGGQLTEFNPHPILAAPDDFTGNGEWFLIVGNRKNHDDFLAAEKIVAGFNAIKLFLMI
jgi:hypothetical protein